MNFLPENELLAVEAFSACLNDTNKSYKFYWLLSILDELNLGKLRISNDDLALRMISLAWYPLDFYKLSFGKKDGFLKLSRSISATMKVELSPNAPSLYHQISSLPDLELRKSLQTELSELLRWVPMRFLRPFFAEQIRGLADGKVNASIKNLVQLNPGVTPYGFEKGHIQMNERWAKYLLLHQHVIRGFVHWHLLGFLQRNNPNVIGLREKLFAPVERNLAIPKDIWFSFMLSNSINCIYSGKILDKEDISVDHFIPWSYIAHDQIWNLIPTTRVSNSAKGNALADLDAYFEKFCELQFRIFKHLLFIKQYNVLEEYHAILCIDDLNNVSYQYFREKLLLEVSTHYRIAAQMGFSRKFSLV